MQTTGLASTSPPSPRNATDNSVSEKPAQTAERFGEVMHRALGDAAAKPNRQKISPSPPADETAPENKSASEDVSVDKKRAKAIKNSEPLLISTTLQFFGIAEAPVATPQRPPVQETGNAHDSNETKGRITPVSNDSAKAEAAAILSTDLETVDQTTEPARLPTNAKTVDQPTEPALLPTNAKTVDQPTKPDDLPTDTETADHSAEPTQISAVGSENAPSAISSVATQQLASQSIEPNSDVANPAEAAIPTESDPPNTSIIDSKPLVAQAGTPPPNTHGTSAAKQDMTMKKAEKTPKVAGSAEQDLPGITTLGSEEMPKGQKLSIKEAFHDSEKLETVAVEMPLRILTSSESPAPTVTAATPTPSPALDSRVLERTHDIVALHAMRIGEYTSDSLHVVVKPGAGIQLSLELRQSARGIEVRASLHKGDFEQLNQHWPDLQQRLEARGVRLASLTTSENFSNSSHQQFQQSKQQSPNQDSLYAGAFAEFALAGSMTEAPAARAARATAYRGWETWA